VTTASVSLILHASRWPAGDRVNVLRALVEEAAEAPVELLRAHDDPAESHGAAARLNEAVRNATGSLLVFAEPAFEWLRGDLAVFFAATRITGRPGALVLAPSRHDRPAATLQGGGSASAQGGGRASASAGSFGGPRSALLASAGRSAARNPGEQLMARLSEVYVDAVASVPHRGPADPPLWAISRARFDELGGLDERLWWAGIVTDLAARQRADGASVHVVGPMGTQVGPDGYPLLPHVQQFLAWRNPIVTAFKTLRDDELGETVAADVAAALLASWRAAGIDPSRLRFGGAWGKRGFAAAMRARLGAPPPADLWPADEAGTVIPLLALNSALDELPRLSAGLKACHHGDPAPTPQPPAPSRRPPAASRGSYGGGRPSGLPSSPQPPAASREPTVSVIVVSWNGREHLSDCFSSILASEYPRERIEVICVDNGSTDGSSDFVAQQFPDVRIVSLPENQGFTGGTRAGVEAASGDVLVFLNNDMRVEPDAIGQLIAAAGMPNVCAAARVLSWDGGQIDFVRGTLNFEGLGFQEHYARPNLPELAASADTFFPNGGAFAVTREAYAASGGFDASFFAYYDDVDLGWRLRLLACEIRTVGDAIVYHRHGATSSRFPDGQKRYLMERNALWTIAKNYGGETLARALPAALLLAARRVTQDVMLLGNTAFAKSLRPWMPTKRWQRQDVRARPYSSGSDTAPERRVLADLPIPSLAALGVALSELPRLAEERRAVQSRRVADDEEVLPHFGRTFEMHELVARRASYVAVHDAVVKLFDLERVLPTRPRLLIISHEALGTNMSGPAVRALEMGRALADVARVTVAAPATSTLIDARCTVAPFDDKQPQTLKRLAEQAEVIVARGFDLSRFPFLTRLFVPIVVDVYCPFTLEHLEQNRRPPGRPEGLPPRDKTDLKETSAGGPESAARLSAVEREARAILDVQNHQLGVGDFFLCASERQRDFWIGALHTAGRVNPRTIADDPSLRRLIDVVPFGLPDAEPAASSPVLKGVHPAIRPSDKLLLWAGSLLDWQDPHTLIRAVARLTRTRDDVKLFFMGVKHPNPQVAPMQIVESSRALAAELGLLDTHVFFNDWVPYTERVAYLREADIGLSTHREHLETRFSFRTRMLDYIWARVPIVCSRGDYFGDLVAERGLGVAVVPGDDEALARAIETLLDDGAARARVKQALGAIADELRWSRVVEPLREFCVAPRFAADRAPTMARVRARLKEQYRVSKWVKRTALRSGISEAQFERFKRMRAVREAMSLRDKLAIARSRRH
jgi:GT2 family glycosyltransferase/glycosyltransferase involved in cell wall biosynthesis